MAKKNKNKRRGPQPTPSSTPPLPKKRDDKDKSATHGQPYRETVESLVIAFVLAFLFRTFQAEAFVIPTGSMAPTLMGRHEDVHCEKCGLRYRVSDSEMQPAELQARLNQNQGRLSPREIVDRYSNYGGQCPNCRDSMLFKPVRGRESTAKQPAYSGDRILVNKYLYSFTDPKRWDVVVFKFPGNAVENYIKRLVGLPGEALRIEHGDVYARSEDSSDYAILRKPPAKMMAMRQRVHDTDYDPADLYEAGFPLRWSGVDGANAWKTDTKVDENLVAQTYSLDATDQTAWLAYEHRVPDYVEWSKVGRTTASGRQQPLESRPSLVTDFNAYNTEITLMDLEVRRQPYLFNRQKGLHWVGDLMLEAKVDVQSDSGTLSLQLVECGQKFRCDIDVATGKATLSTVGFESEEPDGRFSATAQTAVKRSGKYELRLANFDDQLTLWVDGKTVAFDSSTAYDPVELIGNASEQIPRSSVQDPGDLSPAAIGGESVKLSVNRLALYRDIYYIADKSPSRNEPISTISDFKLAVRPVPSDLHGRGYLPPEHTDVAGVRTKSGQIIDYEDLMTDPATWDAFRERGTVSFSLASDNDEELLFVMGDNSAASSDARLWSNGNGRSGSPGGPYLERKHLIGKAVCVYWPHSFNRIPGTPIPFPLFPNLGDMRLVR